MQDLITSFLVQTKECNLPGIGKFRIITTPAELDIASHQMSPPKDEILFTGKPEKNYEELTRYIAYKKNINEKEAEQQFKTWCESAKEKLNEGEKIIFASIGSLQKNASGNIFLQSQKLLNFFEPVAAGRVIHKNAEHAVLVGDRQTTSSAMNQFFQADEIIKDSRWKIMAIILFIIALIVLFFHFYNHSFSISATGNQTIHTPEEPSATYLPQ